MRFGLKGALLAGLAVTSLPMALQGADVNLQTLINGTALGGTLTLNAAIRYVGNATITRDIVIEGNGATIDLTTAPDYRALRVNAGARGDFRNVTIRGGNIGVILLAGSKGLFSGTTIRDCDLAIALDEGTAGLTNCQLLNCSQFGIKAGVTGDTTVNLASTTISGCNLGVTMVRGTLNAVDCTFTAMDQGVILDPRPGAESASLDNCHFENLTTFGIISISRTISVMNGTSFTSIRTPVELRQASVGNFDDVTIDSGTIQSNVGVGIACLDASDLTIRNSTIRRQLNSIDAFGQGGTLTVDHCLIDNPIFSGLAISAGVVFDVRNTEFRGNGQDAIAVDEFHNSGQRADCSGTIDSCTFTDSGDELNPTYNIFERIGSGLVFLGGGPYTVKNCYIATSNDVGIGAGGDAVLTATGNVIWRNKKAGISLGDTVNVTLRDNLVFGHDVPGQAGLSIAFTDTPRTVLAERNFFDSNDFGMIFDNPGHDFTFRDTVFLANHSQGVSISHRGPVIGSSEGTITSDRSVYTRNGQHQVYVKSKGQSSFRNGEISGTNKQGLYTERGACNNPQGVPTIADNNYWGSPYGPVNTCQEAVPNGFVDYQNALVNPARTTTPVEWYRVLNPQNTAPIVSSAGSQQWLTLQSGTPAQADSLVAATRYFSGNILGVAPTGVADIRPVVFYTSPQFRSSAGTVTISMTTTALAGPSRLVRVDEGTGAILGGPFGKVEAGKATFVIASNQLVNGTYFLVAGMPGSASSVIAAQGATPTDDRNIDHVVDAADVTRSILNSVTTLVE